MAAEPRTYRPKVPATWWLRNRRYFGYMMRELSSLFVLVYALLFLGQLLLVGDAAAYASYRAVLQSPLFLGFAALTLGFVLYHAVTWWSLNANVLQVRVRGRLLPPPLLFAGGMVAWILVSVIAYLLLFRGF